MTICLKFRQVIGLLLCSTILLHVMPPAVFADSPTFTPRIITLQNTIGGLKVLTGDSVPSLSFDSNGNGKVDAVDVISILSSLSSPDFEFNFDSSNQAGGANKIIPNSLAHFNYFNADVWLYSNEFSMAKEEFEERFPYAKIVHIMAAIGGNEDRDAYIEFPRPPAGITFPAMSEDSKIITTCKSITSKGLVPLINLTAVPLNLSDDPFISGFDVNIRPPRNYDQWYNYIQAVVTGLRDYCANDRDDLPEGFSVPPINEWYWELGLEYDNKSWFDAGTADSSQTAFFKIYDYGVEAIRSVLGNDFIVGTHAMVSSKYSYWDPLTFFDHVTNETNFKTGSIGSKVDYFAVSHYQKYPGILDAEDFMTELTRVKEKLQDVGLTDLPVGINEGRVMKGWDEKPLHARIVQHPMQAPFDAKLFKTMIANDIAYFSAWGDRNPRSISSNTSTVLYKMVGESLVKQLPSQFVPVHSGNEVDVLASYQNDSVHFLVFNSNDDRTADSSERVTVTLNNIKQVDPAKDITITRWLLDEDHSNWWKTWLNDSKNFTEVNYDYSWSRYGGYTKYTSTFVDDSGTTLDAQQFWKDNMSRYADVGVLYSESATITGLANSRLDFIIDIPHHGLYFYQLENVSSK